MCAMEYANDTGMLMQAEMSAPSNVKPKKLKNTSKWEEQTNNSEKVRFIFVDYMIAKIKDGYIFHHNRTPDEMKNEIAESEDEGLLFDTYRKARYAGSRSLDEIDNLTVEKLRTVTKEKK